MIKKRFTYGIGKDKGWGFFIDSEEVLDEEILDLLNYADELLISNENWEKRINCLKKGLGCLERLKI